MLSPKETKKSTGNEKAVVVSSHYDSVVGAPGANDNARTGLVLELARAFQNVETDKEIRFITFGSEETGLLGSDYYVNSLSRKNATVF